MIRLWRNKTSLPWLVVEQSLKRGIWQNYICISLLWTSVVAQTVKRLSIMRETQVRSLGREDPLEKEMAMHSSTVAWKIPWMEEPGRLQSVGLRRVGHNGATSFSLFTFRCWRRKWQLIPLFLPGIPGTEEPGGLSSMASHRVRHD